MGGTAATSAESRYEIYVEFRNFLNQPVTLLWLNYEGQPVRYHVLAPGDSVEQPTWCTHVWLFKGRRDGKVYGTYVATTHNDVVENWPSGPRTEAWHMGVC
jgi:hypothetical protein